MKRGSTHFLRAAVVLIGLTVLLICMFTLPFIAKEETQYDAAIAGTLYPVLISMYIAAIPFFVALYQALKLLSFIDKSNAFSELSVKALRNIKLCAVIISGIYLVAMPFFYLLGEKDDAPGVIAFGLLFIFGSLVIAVFTAVLQKLLQNAIEIKSENDLTV